MIKKSANKLFEGFKKGDITTTQFKAVSYTKLRGNLTAAGKVAVNGDQAHHLIPLSIVLKSNVMERAVKLGFDYNSAKNGEFVNIFTHLGENFYNHPIYNRYASMLIDNLQNIKNDKLLKELDKIIDELNSVVNEAKQSGRTLDQISESRISK